MKYVAAGILVLACVVLSAQQPGSSAIPTDVESWMHAAWGAEARELSNTDTHFLLSLTESERQGAFLFRQRCSTCHYSTIAAIGGRPGLLSERSAGPSLTRKSVEGRESAARQKITDGSTTMPAFKYALRPEQIDHVISYLRKVDQARPPVLEQLIKSAVTSGMSVSSGKAAGSPQGGPTIFGTITASTGQKLEGVTVSVRAVDRNVTTSVFTDREGEYYLPELEPGKSYRVWAQAQGFEAERAELRPGGGRERRDFVMRSKGDFEAQLTGDQWYAALPETTRDDRRMKEVFRAACMGCHAQNFTLLNRFDEQGWKNIITVMGRMGPYGYNNPPAADQRQPNALMGRFGDKLAAWLAKVRGPGPSPMKFVARRPTGDSTLMVVREYDSPERGFGLPFFNDGSDWSLGPVDFMDESKHHAMNATIDHDGNVWAADFFNITRTVVKYDWKTGEATNVVVKETPESWPANAHDIIADDDGIIWFDMSSIGALGRIDPRIGKVETLRPPAGVRVASWIGGDGKSGIWASARGSLEDVARVAAETGGSEARAQGASGSRAGQEVRAARYDTKTRQWRTFPSAIPGASSYGMIGDGEGNGWWSTATPRDGLMKADFKTGQSSFVAVPKGINDSRKELFTPEEQALFDQRLDWYGYGRPGAVAVRKPGADPRGSTVWGPTWYGGGLVKIDTRSNRSTIYPFPPEAVDANCYEASVDKDGMVWVVFTHGDAVAKFNPRTEKWTMYYLPTVSVKSHGLQAVTVNGRTEIGLAYLGAGKAAKLQFRTREALNQLKAEIRRAR